MKVSDIAQEQSKWFGSEMFGSLESTSSLTEYVLITNQWKFPAKINGYRKQ